MKASFRGRALFVAWVVLAIAPLTAAQRRVSIVSWNVWGLPFHHAPSRLPRVVERIRSIGPDFVILQEVWLRPYATHFRNAFENRYDFAEYKSIAPLRTGGLLVLADRSRGWHVTGTRFVEFRRTAPFWRVWEMDGLSGKGFLVVDVRNDDGTSLRLIATHLQSQYGKGREYEEVRGAQLTQLNDFVRSYAATPIVLAGDFNTTPKGNDAKLYHSFADGMWTDFTAIARAKCLPLEKCGTHFNGTALTNEWIDYIFARPESLAAATVDLIRNQPPLSLSDHEGVQALIDIK